jgi:carboxyl-terminal processing protease
MRPGTALLVMFPLVLVVAAFVLVANRGAGAGPMDASQAYWDEDVARFVRERVAATYVDEVGPEQGADAFAKAMDAYVKDLDEYCDYIPPEEHRLWQEHTSGEYAGLGIKIQVVPEGLMIVGMLPGGPAETAGIHRGDTLVRADGVSLAGLGFDQIEAQHLLKGDPGSQVRIDLLPGPRPENGPAPGPARTVVARRAVIRPPTVFTRRVGEGGRYGVIRITEFAEATEEDFDAALDGLRADDVAGIVLDLRNNGGGVLPAAVGVVDRFVRRGTIVRMEGRAPRSTRQYTAHPENTVPDTLPLVLLVNGGSASASEVVAGALQDHRRALLVGERTYGKFLVQQITDIPGRDAALQLTTSRYYLPSGRSYQRSPKGTRGPDGGPPKEAAGILPDIVVPLDDATRAQLAAAQVNEEAAPWGEAVPHPEVAADWIDPQLGRALELLQGQMALRRIRGAPSETRPQ